MCRDVITIGLKMRISLLYQGEYSQWREWFMIYLEEQTDGEAMIHSITYGLPNDIYSLIDSNDTAQELWDSLERQMGGSEYDEQDRKAAILYEYETFKATEGEQLVDTYLRYLQVINDLKKYGYKKDKFDYDVMMEENPEEDSEKTPGVMINWLEENDGVNESVSNEDIEDKDVEIELDDDAELIFLYEEKEADVAPEDTFGTITQRPYAVRDFPRGVFEVGEPSSAHDSSYVGGIALGH
ncbi:hypothetical protein Tco_0629678 [Tanacetum coccineum]|uniref:Zinc finger, CCHC-type n=1 Tax=Tanacetum coccineum TaxID=301880 RepID=A0ABQ4WTV6_9ASTR